MIDLNTEINSWSDRKFELLIKLKIEIKFCQNGISGRNFTSIGVYGYFILFGFQTTKSIQFFKKKFIMLEYFHSKNVEKKQFIKRVWCVSISFFFLERVAIESKVAVPENKKMSVFHVRTSFLTYWIHEISTWWESGILSNFPTLYYRKKQQSYKKSRSRKESILKT